MYPRTNEEVMLLKFFELHRGLYNSALQERIDAYKKFKKSVTYNDQARALTEIRGFDEDYASLNAQSCQATLKKLDRAFKAFFQRCKTGHTPGFPRFKGRDRFTGWGYNSHGDGYKMITLNGKTAVRISGVGTIRLRGKARFSGTPKTAEVFLKNGNWYLSVSLEVAKEAVARTRVDSKVLGFDWGVENFLTCYDGQKFSEVSNPRFFQQIKDRLTELQQELAQLKRGSRKYRQCKYTISKLRIYEANCRKDFQHKLTQELVRDCKEIYTEKLNIQNMTASAKGTIEEPGKRVRQKSGLNREILATAPRQFLEMLRYKAEEAGTKFLEFDTKKLKASQRCGKCGDVVKKSLSIREHHCEKCGFETSRDRNSALVLWNEGFKFYGLEQSACADRKVG